MRAFWQKHPLLQNNWQKRADNDCKKNRKIGTDFYKLSEDPTVLNTTHAGRVAKAHIRLYMRAYSQEHLLAHTGK